jgi:superfamily I DNA/RNA helicase
MGDEGILGADPVAEMTAQFQLLMNGSENKFSNRSATESAHIELICERLRLLYVGITRARSYLHISRSHKTKPFQTEYDVIPATVMQTIYQFINDY